jgi:hypothetical protein
MKIYVAREEQIDERLALDKRRNVRGFYRYFDSEAELPFGFFDLQDKVRDGLRTKFNENFDNGIPGEYNLFYFPEELLTCEQIGVELSREILGNQLLGIILKYLDDCESRYCVVGAVYESMQRHSKYLGRFVANCEEIAVEESLYGAWSTQVTLLDIYS